MSIYTQDPPYWWPQGGSEMSDRAEHWLGDWQQERGLILANMTESSLHLENGTGDWVGMVSG